MTEPGSLGRWRVLLFAVTTGTMVANLYYVQPLLAAVAASFGHDVTSAGYLVTFTQLGYALGLLLVVPLADVLDRRQLLSIMLAIDVGGLLTAAISTGFTSLPRLACWSAAHPAPPWWSFPMPLRWRLNRRGAGS